MGPDSSTAVAAAGAREVLVVLALKGPCTCVATDWWADDKRAGGQGEGKRRVRSEQEGRGLVRPCVHPRSAEPRCRNVEGRTSGTLVPKKERAESVLGARKGATNKAR